MIKEFAKPTRSIQAAKTRMKNKFLSLLFLLSGIVLAVPACNTEELGHQFSSGVYENLMLAVNDKGELSGYYRESLGEGVVRTCTFYLQGKAEAGQANIITWNAEVYPGNLKVDKDDVILKVEQGRGHPGCASVLLPEIAEGIGYTRTYKADWKKLKVVKLNKIYLYSEPVTEKKRSSYLIKNDVLGVLAENSEWVHIEFPRPGKPLITAWVRKDEVEDLTAPVR